MMPRERFFCCADCLPNVPENNLEAILGKGTRKIMIKTSPLLDLSAGLKELDLRKEFNIFPLKMKSRKFSWILEGAQLESAIKTANLNGF